MSAVDYFKSIYNCCFNTVPLTDKVVNVGVLQLIWHCVGLYISFPVGSTGGGPDGPTIWTLIKQMGAREEERLISNNYTRETAHVMAEAFVHRINVYTILHFCLHGLGIVMAIVLVGATKMLSSIFVKIWLLWNGFQVPGFLVLCINAYLAEFYGIIIFGVSLAVSVVQAYLLTLVWTFHKKLPEISQQSQNHGQEQQNGNVGNNDPVVIQGPLVQYTGTNFQGPNPIGQGHGQLTPVSTTPLQDCNIFLDSKIL